MKDNFTPIEFEKRYGTIPSYYITAPGRVNLIGEHTDYNGLPVLPISIPHSIKAYISIRNDKLIKIVNINHDYTEASFELSDNIQPSAQGHWENYVKAAVQAICKRDGNDLHGMNVLFDGDIPKSAGLSSSSALVIASALSFIAVNSISIGKLELAEMMSEGEKYVGTQGGGMDQAISIFGKANNAVKIDFFPLRINNIPFPEGYSIVVAHSLILASKSKDAMYHFNTRSGECRLATALINKLHKPSREFRLPSDVVKSNLFAESGGSTHFLDKTFKDSPYSLAEMAEITGETEEYLISKYFTGRNCLPIPIPEEGFKLKKRLKHIFSEAERVEKSCEALLNGNASEFGILMSLSHESCANDYGISTPELDELVRVMKESGALGARLTGAGFGGCAVALVDDKETEKIISRINNFYYDGYIKSTHPGLTENPLFHSRIVFAIKPSDGAIVKDISMVEVHE
jgi:N-acetylgalactosamine kinase